MRSWDLRRPRVSFTLKKILSEIMERPAVTKSPALRAFAAVLLLSAIAFSQSTSQQYPTPVLSNEISGVVKARDIGDGRVTQYFYTFNGQPGDLFLNVVTSNFTGDIDVFTVDGLRPLTKIVVYPDTSQNETGRVIYLRKDERMILRIEGRSPNDDPATFTIKFAGGFVAANADIDQSGVAEPVVKNRENGDVAVNSVGTIIPAAAKARYRAGSESEREAEKETPSFCLSLSRREAETPRKTPTLVITDGLPKAADSAAKKRPVRTPSPRPVKRPPVKKAARSATTTPPAVTEKPVDPLANVRLVIVFKDGKVITRPINDVFHFSMDKAVLTVINKDGSIGKYALVDVSKVSIE